MFYKNNKFSIRTYSFGAVSVIVGVFIALALGGNNVYASEADSGRTPTAVIPVSTTEPTTPDGSINGVEVNTDTNGDDSSLLPAVPTPVLPGFYAD